MIQSLKLLQETTLQLEQRIMNELAMNPLLESDESLSTEQVVDEPGGNTDDDGDLNVSENEIDVEEYLEDGFAYNYDSSSSSYNGSSATDSQEKQDYMESLQVYEETLEEYLLSQLHDLHLAEEDEFILDFLISSLNEDGRLNIPQEEIATLLNIDSEAVTRNILLLQKFEPAGIGAQSLQECLSLQLKATGRNFSLANAILEDEWELFEKLKIPALAKAFEVTPSEVQSAIDEIKQLDPKPGRQFLSTKSGPVVPDLIIEELDGELVIVINDKFLPDIRINKGYSDMLKRKSGATTNVKDFLREKYNSANWLIRAVEQRRTTMLKVMQAIVDKQDTFFKEGPPNLNPLKLQDIADEIGMHISTISRVTNNKYVQTPYGLFELKYFFSEALGKSEDGEDISTARIKNRLAEMIGEEEKKKPLSDQKLSELMTKEGFALARRTVAKYREQLGIPTARMRKSYD